MGDARRTEVVPERDATDDDKLVLFCDMRYDGLKAAFTLSDGGSMIVQDLGSKTLKQVEEMVKVKGGPWELVSSWLKEKDLRRFLEDYQSPGVVKKAKTATLVPSGVFGDGQGPDDYVRAITECSLQPIPWQGDGDNPNVLCASLPEHMSWLTLSSRHLFIRSRYEELWRIVDDTFCIYKDTERDGRVGGILLLGNTGIGKTAALSYFLRRALEKNYRVLFETRKKRYYFSNGTMEWELIRDASLYHHRSYSSVLFLVDHKIGESPPSADAFTVAPVSPDPANYSEWDKNRVARLWMPLTTSSEVAAMNTIEPRLSESDLQARMDLYGPIPRQVFRVDQATAQQLLVSKVASFDLVECRKRGVLVSGELPESKHGLSCWVLHVTTSDLKVPSKISWATQGIMNSVLEKYRAFRLHELESEIASLLSQPSAQHAPDGEFEYWACHVIASGRKVDLLSPRYVGNKCVLGLSDHVVQLPSNDVVLIRTIANVPDLVQHVGVVYYSQRQNEPLCDAAAVHEGELLLFQMTIGKEHSFKEQTWRQYCNAAHAANLTRVRFIFVVPHQGNFRVSQEQVKLFQSDFGIPVSLHVAELLPKEIVR